MTELPKPIYWFFPRRWYTSLFMAFLVAIGIGTTGAIQVFEGNDILGISMMVGALVYFIVWGHVTDGESND